MKKIEEALEKQRVELERVAKAREENEKVKEARFAAIEKARDDERVRADEEVH